LIHLRRRQALTEYEFDSLIEVIDIDVDE